VDPLTFAVTMKSLSPLIQRSVPSPIASCLSPVADGSSTSLPMAILQEPVVFVLPAH